MIINKLSHTITFLYKEKEKSKESDLRAIVDEVKYFQLAHFFFSLT